MEPSDRIALLRTVAARYDRCDYRAVIEASLLLTTCVLPEAFGCSDAGLPDLRRSFTASAVSVGASALLSLLSMLLTGTAIVSDLLTALPCSVVLSTAVADQVLAACEAQVLQRGRETAGVLQVCRDTSCAG